MDMSSSNFIESIVVLENFSHGKFSRVFLGRQSNATSHLKAPYFVVKVYCRDKSKSRSQRILSEKAVMQRSAVENNPYTAKLLFTTKNIEKLYFIIEAYECGHLNHHIRESERGRMSAVVARKYAAEIVSALLSLMKCGCIHRDIKAKNLLVDKFGHLKLCDFGSSKILFDQEQLETILIGGPPISPRTFSIVGTKQCMAPEIIAKSCGYSFPVDWWAFGVLLFEMLCGALPAFKGACTLDNETTIELAMAGAWPDDATSLTAQNAVRLSISELDSTVVSCGDWSPVLTASNAAVLSSSDLHCSGWTLIQSLLTPCPDKRLGPWDAEALKENSFFEGINWAEVDAGVSPPPDLSFNQHLGFNLEDYEDNSMMTADDDHDSRLFEGF